jgi:outer membrane protein
MNKVLPGLLTVLCLLTGFSIPAFAQTGSPNVFTLSDIINLARAQSISAKQAETTRENRYWQYQTYRSNYRPQLTLDGVFPAFNRSYDEVRQPDGTIQFLPISYNNSQLNLRLSQSIGITGTQLFLNTNVNRFDNFEGDDRYWLYSGTPMEFGIVQPLFQFNDLRWDNRIEPLRFEESKRAFVEDLENISMTATRLFFNLMLAQVNYGIAQLNLANNDTIFKIAEGRYNLGKIAENELLQLELTLMNSRQALSQARLDLETFSLRLRQYVGLTDLSNIQLVLPDEIPDFSVDEQSALAEARRNRSDAVGFERQNLEADREIARARGNAGPNADLIARFGLTNRTEQDGQISELFREPANRQVVNLAFNVPIVDWGRRKSRVKTAEANQLLVNFSVSQDQLTFDEEVLTLVRQIEVLREQVKITAMADEISLRRYDISKNRYMIGNIGITDLNIALQEKDQAKGRYIQSLEDFWLAYYNLRRLTLYDFKNQQRLVEF